MPDEVQAETPQIPWRKMKGLRNIAAHEYFGIDLSTVWQTATVDVPALKLEAIPPNRGTSIVHNAGHETAPSGLGRLRTGACIVRGVRSQSR